MKNVTSVTLFKKDDMQRLAYTFSVIDEDKGVIVSENNRGDMVVLDLPDNADILQQIDAIKEYVTDKMGG